MLLVSYLLYYLILILIVYFASWLLLFYSLQVLITIWKELNNNDKYTPFVTPESSGLHFNTISKHFNSYNQDNQRQIENKGSQKNDENQVSSYFWEYSIVFYF